MNNTPFPLTFKTITMIAVFGILILFGAMGRLAFLGRIEEKNSQ